MEVPSTLRALWAQRTRWARGQGEVLHAHFREVIRWRNHRMWLVSFESLASLVWIVTLVAAFVMAVIAAAFGVADDVFGLGLAWGIAIAVVATIQVLVALKLQHGYDPTAVRALLIGALYPPAYWLVNAAASMHSQTVALIRGPWRQRVVWDIPRERLEPEPGVAEGAPPPDR
ncbi:MAG: hypothetical protein ACRDNG_05550 [Gaiellaceae bacterium]